jgi:mannose-6-phosphate isomerase class I
MQVLIKFTQAQNNSYQVHVKPGKEFGKWLPKPESWYYLEKGKATLGLSDPSQSAAYKARCVEIDLKAHQLSDQVRAGEMTLDAAKLELKTFIDQDHPRRFVNTITVEKDAVIDLSQGGTHHSWEVDADLPDGNIVYEVQVDVMDDYCTIRSFDQANIKNDGSVRPLAIDDYFQALDLDPTMNDPAHFLQHAAVETDGNAQLKTLFNNQFYVTELVEFDGVYTGKATQTQESFHHLYPLVESIKVVSGTESWFVPAGWSFFIPASLQQYQIESTGTHGKVLITHL